MPHVFHIKSTDGSTLTLTLEPGMVDGPGSPRASTDLKLYGLGSLMWGEGVDQNFVRLIENFAADEKTPGWPQDHDDLGPGNGINHPMEGQHWYNKTDKQMYYYSTDDGGSPIWKKTSAVVVNTTAPDSAKVGDLWYDIDVSGGCGNPLLKIQDPTHPDADVDGWVEVAFDRVSVCGGSMSGILDMSADGGTSRNRITNVGNPTQPYDAVHKQYVDDAIAGQSGTLSLHVADADLHLSAVENEFLDSLETNCIPTQADAIQVASDICALKGYTNNTGSVYNAVNSKVPLNGGTMTGRLTLSADPTANMHAATKQYVDNEIGGGLSGGASRYVRFYTSTSGGTPQNGDIAIESNIVYIYRNGWVQVFPAIYS